MEHERGNYVIVSFCRAIWAPTPSTETIWDFVLRRTGRLSLRYDIYLTTITHRLRIKNWGKSRPFHVKYAVKNRVWDSDSSIFSKRNVCDSIPNWLDKDHRQRAIKEWFELPRQWGPSSLRRLWFDLSHSYLAPFQRLARYMHFQ